MKLNILLLSLFWTASSFAGGGGRPEYYSDPIKQGFACYDAKGDLYLKLGTELSESDKKPLTKMTKKDEASEPKHVYNGTLYVENKTIDVFIEMQEIKNDEYAGCSLSISEKLTEYGSHGGYYESWCSDKDDKGRVELKENGKSIFCSPL